MSQFPNTPISEFGPSPPLSGYSNIDPGSYVSGRGSMPANPAYRTAFDDGDDASEGYTNSPSESGRATPNGFGRRVQGTQSLPPHAREREREQANAAARPRAQTEDSNSRIINQWRSQTPNGYPAMPTLPRGTSMTSTASESSVMPNLRSSAGARGLRHKQSHEWGTIGVLNKTDDYTPPQMTRQNGQAYATVTPAMRSRSASSPHVYQVPSTNGQSSPYGEVPSVPPLAIPSKPSANTSSSSLAYQSSSSAANKRSSQSSVGTDLSSGDSNGQQNYSSATSPASSVPSSRTAMPNGNRQGQRSAGSAVKIKVNYGEDVLTIVVLNTITFDELVAKVLKKIRLCGDRAKVDESSIRLRYEDEEGDRVTISADDDVAMAFDLCRTFGCDSGGSASLSLYVD
jgi:cell division control protein 24